MPSFPPTPSTASSWASPGMQERLFYMAPLSDEQRKQFAELWETVKTDLGK